MNRLAVLEQLVCQFGNRTDDFRSTTTFEDMNMNSYAVVDFLMEVEKEFGIVIPDDKIFSLHTMQDVLDMIEDNIKEEKRC